MDKTYKDILNERIAQYGVTTLTDDEVLSLITGIPLPNVKNSIEQYGLPELAKFTSNLPLTNAQKKKLDLIYLLVKRINHCKYKEKISLSSSSKAGEYFVSQLQFYPQEVFAIALLNSQNRLIKTETLFVGTINEAPVYPREIVKLVLNNHANAVIVAHNHPGGNQQPSKEDIEVTKRINAVLKTISVSLIDHIIVAENQYTSMAEKGLLNV